MKRNRSIFRGCLAAAVLATLIGGNAWAATYDRGLTGSTDDQEWLTTGTVTETGGTVTYTLNGEDHAFQANEEDFAALYVPGKKVVIANRKDGQGKVSFTASNGSYLGADAITLADGSHLTIHSDLQLSAYNPGGYAA